MPFTRLLLPLLTATLVLAGCTTLPGENVDDPPTTAAPRGDTLQVIYVDVGQGDGTIWLLPGGGAIVYDCGPAAGSPDENPMVRALRAAGFPAGATLGALIASHGHLDHIGGCQEILSEYHVQDVYETWYEGADRPKSYQRFQDELLAEVDAGATLHVVSGAAAPTGSRQVAAGDVLQLTATVQAEFLWPAGPTHDWDDVAQHSFVIRLSHGDVDFCFQGDIEIRDEEALAQRFGSRDCDVYLVGHHGSRHASSTPWLQAMQPKLAIASVGSNPYGHPHPDALGRLRDAGVPVMATLTNGTITVTSNGVDFTADAQRTGEALDDGATPPQAPADAWILGVNADPAGADNDNLADEWVHMRNPTDHAVDFTGWTLQDAADTTYTFPDGFTLEAGAEVKVRTGDGDDTATDLYWGRRSAVWNNSGDVAVLYDDHDIAIADYAY